MDITILIALTTSIVPLRPFIPAVFVLQTFSYRYTTDWSFCDHSLPVHEYHILKCIIHAAVVVF